MHGDPQRHTGLRQNRPIGYRLLDRLRPCHRVAGGRLGENAVAGGFDNLAAEPKRLWAQHFVQHAHPVTMSARLVLGHQDRVTDDIDERDRGQPAWPKRLRRLRIRNRSSRRPHCHSSRAAGIERHRLSAMVYRFATSSLQQSKSRDLLV
jgi:hypothetical protein